LKFLGVVSEKKDASDIPLYICSFCALLAKNIENKYTIIIEAYIKVLSE
jgi:hypothetical protein